MAGRGLTQFNKLSRHKILLAAVVLLAIFLLVGIVLASAGVLGRSSELVSIMTLDESTDFVSNGYGINLDYIPISNMVRDPSFEKQTFSYALKVADSDDNNIYFSSEEIFNSDFDSKPNRDDIVGSEIRVLSSGNSGNFLQSYEGIVTDFSEAQLGVLYELSCSDKLNTSEHIKKLVEIDNTVVALTDDGHIICDLLSDMTQYLGFEDEVFVDICRTANGIASVTENGAVYFSSDGRSFSKISGDFSISAYYSENKLSDTALNPAVVGLTYSNHVLTIALDSGDLAVLSNGTMTVVQASYGQGIMTADSDYLSVLINSEGQVFVSANSVIYCELNPISEAVAENLRSESANAADFINCAKVVGTELYLVGTNGKILIADLSELDLIPDSQSLIEANRDIRDENDIADKEESVNLQIPIYLTGELNLEGITISHADILDRFRVVIQDVQGRAYLVDMTEPQCHINELTTDNVFSDNVFTLSDDKVIIVGGNNLYTTSVYSCVRVNNIIGEDSIMPGNLCYIDIVGSGIDMPEVYSPWSLYGDNAELFTDSSGAVGCGNSAAVIKGTGDGLHILSQEIGVSPSQFLAQDSFYRMSINLKQKDMNSQPIDVWLSVTRYNNLTQQEETLYQEGFTIDKVGSKYKYFDYVFAVTSDFSEDKYKDASLRLNIAYEGEGTLHVDGLYVGLDKYSDASIVNTAKDLIIEGAPRIIRLNNLNYGSSGYSSSSMYSLSNNSGIITESDELPGCLSLEDSLRLVKESNSIPWLVIGSDADYDSVNSLIEYLCGSIGSEYGRIRIDNGTAVPWNRQFDSIIIEINDSDNTFESDNQRSAYVNFIMKAVQQSEFYNDIKDEAVFVDGMKYDGGTVLSSADYHCGNLTVDYYDFEQRLYEVWMSENNVSQPESDNAESEAQEDLSVSEANETLPSAQEILSSRFVKACNELYQDYYYSVPRHNRSGTSESGEFISSLQFTGMNSANEFNAAQIMSFLMCDQASFYKSIMINMDFDGYSITELENSESEDLYRFERSVVNVIGQMSFAEHSGECICQFINPLNRVRELTAEEFVNCAYSRAFVKDNVLYVVVFNTSDELIRFNLRSEDFVFEKNEYSRYSYDAELLYKRELNSGSKYYNLQPGEYMICEIIVES